MGKLIVRNLDDALVLALERRAARHGRSAEAEHRAILREVLASETPEASFKDFLAAMPDVGKDEDFALTRDLPREVSW